jgi:superfamily I DNA/RNA helicase
VVYSDTQHLWPALGGILRRLTEEERVPTDQIAVLTPLLRIKSALLDSSLSGAPQLTDSLPVQPGQAYCTTIHRFKGLERAVILLAGIGQRLTQENHDLNSLLYVGCSRARHHLIVLVPENADRRVQKAFASYKNELTPNHDPATDRDPA